MGYRCFVVANSDFEAAVVMTSSDIGAEFIQEIVRSVAQEYGCVDYPLKWYSSWCNGDPAARANA